MNEYKVGTVVSDINTLLTPLMNVTACKKREFDHEQKKAYYVTYLNVPAAFDIEASSFKVNDEKYACMYIWQFGINGNVVIGRTWQEFMDCMKAVYKFFGLNDRKRLPIYVHNLPYDSQFFRKYFKWDKVFAKEKRKPLVMKAGGIEFRDSLALAGCSLETVGEDLVKYKVEKMVGDLDYDLLRAPVTPLDEKELRYCYNDVLVLMSFIQEQIEIFGDVAKIPMTKTGIVREYCREHCLKDKKTGKRYRKLMSSLTIGGEEEYLFLKDAFAGGFTHANYRMADKVWKNVTSYDFTSSYPAVMLSELYPMSSGRKIKIIDRKHYERLVEDGYGIIFNVAFKNIIGITEADHYLSESKCKDVKKAKIDNGRIMSADYLWTTITNVDFEVIDKCYTWEEITFGVAYIYDMAPLPKELIECIIHFYKGKTELKDVPGQEVEYQILKGMLNAIYGCSVQDIINDNICYECDEWADGETDPVEEQIRKYNENKKRFLFYPWGIFITAYARRNLWTGIIECGKDYIYSDTDSVKILNAEKHQEYFNNYNEIVTKKIKFILNSVGIDENSACPKTKDGVEKPLGVWDFDGEYTRFKTLGAKRYLVEYKPKKKELEKLQNGKGEKEAQAYFNRTNLQVKCTIAGVNKHKTSLWLMKKDTFNTFNDHMEVPEDYSGRLIAYYVKDENGHDKGFKNLTVTDYLGNTTQVSERSYIHMEKSSYNLKLSDVYARLVDAAEEVIL